MNKPSAGSGAPNVAVLAGGLTHERDVSLRSGARLGEALRQNGFAVSVLDADSSLIRQLTEHRPDVVVNALHGGPGENGAIQGILEMMDIPHIGTLSRDCRLSWDKPTAKSLVAAAGGSTPDWVTLSHHTFRDLGAEQLIQTILSHFELPIIVKPSQGGSALGVQVARSAEALSGALVHCFSYNDVAMLERYVDGVEIAVAVTEADGPPAALPPVEIEYSGDVLDYETRYTPGLASFHAPARLSAAASAAVAELALLAHRVLRLRDVSRTDIIVAPDDTVHFLEATTSPGLTETSAIGAAAESVGMSLGDLYGGLLTRRLAEPA